MMTGALDKGTSAGLPVKLIMLGGAVLLLLSGVVLFDRTRAAQLQAARQLSAMEAQLSAAHERQQLAQRNRMLIQGAQQLQKQAQSSSYVPETWGERQVNMKMLNLSRNQINPMLLSIARSKSQLLKLEEFDLAVTHADEGLFDVILDSRQPLLLTFRGSLYFRLSERSL